MRVTKWGEYALLFCIYLGKQHGAGNVKIGAAELGTACKIPTAYAQQVLHRLRKSKVISSSRGPKGGFTLVKAPSELTLREILLAAEGETFEVMCDSHPLYSECRADGFQCSLKTVWHDVKNAIDNTLDNISLQSIIDRNAVNLESELVNIERRSVERRNVV